MNPDPRWRVLLYWGTVISFFTLPFLVFCIHLALIGYPQILQGNAPGHVGEFKYVFEFHRTLAAHMTPGCSGGIDCNSYPGTPEQLAAEWASGTAAPPSPPLPPSPPSLPPPSDLIVTITISTPPGVTVKVNQAEVGGS